MSLNFSQITALIDDTVNTNDTTYPLADKARDVNIALDRVLALIFQVGGTWQFDDSNHTDYPIITTNLVSGQRDYSFVSDENGNLILEVQRVFCADPAGIFHEIYPVDVPNGANRNYTSGQNITGTPTTYDKNATGIFLDAIPSYNSTNGLKVYVNREGSYFTAGDTTKKPGFAGLFHEYLVLHTAYKYAVRKGLAKANQLKGDMLEMENDLIDYYEYREKDTKTSIIPVSRSAK